MKYKKGIQTQTQLPKRYLAPGFALIATISILVLLALISVGLLSLSTVTIRTASASDARTEARANAKLAMMIALGRLQSELGADQRISANAAITNTGSVPNPHWLGAWDSWKAGNETSGDDKASDHQTIATNGTPQANSLRPSYNPQRADHFREWLVSTTDKDLADINLPMATITLNENPGKSANSVTLVGDGSLGSGSSNNDKVTVGLVDVFNDDSSPTKKTGRYGFWVGDENQKARIIADEYIIKENNEGLAKDERLFQNQAVGSNGTRSFVGLQNVPTNKEKDFDKAISFGSLDLVNNADVANLPEAFHHSTTHSVSVLTDVREGGLKRDLSLLLDQPISKSDTLDDHMLFRLSSGIEDCAPISDLAAYYQLYRDSNVVRDQPGSQGPNSIGRDYHVSSADFGNGNSLNDKYDNIYRTPVVVKVQLVVSFKRQNRESASRATVIEGKSGRPGVPPTKYTNDDPYRLIGGVSPAVTLWNPYNVPIAMKAGDARSTQIRLSNIPMTIQWEKYSPGKGTYKTTDNSSLAAVAGIQGTDAGGSDATFFCFVGDKDNDVVFQPGEVRIFSLGADAVLSQGNVLRDVNRELVMNSTWDPNDLLETKFSVEASRIKWQNKGGGAGKEVPNVNTGNDWKNSDIRNLDYYERSNDRTHKLITGTISENLLRTSGGKGKDADGNDIDISKTAGASLTFRDGDEIYLKIFPTKQGDSGNDNSNNANEGSAFRLTLQQNSVLQAQAWTRDHYMFSTPMWGGGNTGLNSKLLDMGLEGSPGITEVEGRRGIAYEPLSSAQLTDVPTPVMLFNLMAPAEAYQGNSIGSYDGRKFPARPFLHSSPISSVITTGGAEPKNFYHHGWSWWIEEVTGGLIENMGTNQNGRNGYYGGGYTSASGTSHVVQQEIPLVPPISIASLSHAFLGGYTISDEGYNHGSGKKLGSQEVAFHDQVRATGHGGLFPHTVQAIGNSYAHPYLPPESAVGKWSKLYKETGGGTKELPFVDQSYLANKALWDEYFFSSITTGGGTIMNSTGKVKDVAESFLDGTLTSLPNTRIRPYTYNYAEGDLDDMFKTARVRIPPPAKSKAVYEIASHLMVDGGFNVNSTSIEAWKALFSSFRQKSVASSPKAGADSGGSFDETEIGSGGLASAFSLPLGTPSDAPDASSEQEQWLGFRELTTTEIDQLANAMVRQVKLRGPFLSLSEFVNRRLDSSNDNLSLKGALQAALDDSSVDINAAFRGGDRAMSDEEKDFDVNGVQFAKAMDGPVAYGSSAYVDQADILRGLAEQITVRGDTFIIRTYGDSLDSSGNVTARAWCEAIVQRTPEYLDSSDQDHLEFDSLTSEMNKEFGRRFRVIQFRFLDKSEV